ncbi:MAG: hypothetical protein D6753_00325 [Planctomycetota bacterium]|nr:MAG: hypothetical protein D6753_00325 [Planctomycetota bacterium]
MQRWFGLSLAGLIAFIAWALRPTLGWFWWAGVALAVGMAVVYYLCPKSQRPIIRAWQTVTLPIAWGVSHLLLGGVYFLIVTPIGLFLRWTGHDPLELKAGQPPTWKDKTQAPPERYVRQS